MTSSSGVPMQKLDHGKLREIAEKATPGPWFRSGLPWFSSSSAVLAGSPDPHVGGMVADTETWNGERDELIEGGAALATADDDARFIAAFNPEIVLALLSEHSVLTEEVERLKRSVKLADQAYDAPSKELVEADASSERMRKALEEAHKVITVVRRNIMVEVIGGNERFQGVPEILANDISNIAQALQGLGGGDQGAAQSQGWVPTHRHVKRGSVYRLVADAVLQSEAPVSDDAYLALYQGEDGKYWVRPADEFKDGRFEPMLAKAEPGAPQ